jgi:hypothetical protein
MPKRLANATISFHTNDEDKDHDTHVTVTIRDVNSLVCAQVDNDWGHFDDQSDAGPFGLNIRNRQTADLLQSGNLTIRIDPNGHDTWRFNFNLVLTCGDGATLSGGVQGLQLSQNNKQMDFGLEGLLTIASTSSPLTASVYINSAMAHNLVLDVAGASSKAGTPVVIYPVNEPTTPNQLWTLDLDGYISSEMDTNLVLDAAGAVAEAGTPVHIWPRNSPPTANQLWTLTSEGYIASNMNPNLVLDVPSANSTPGNHLQIYPKNNPSTSNQIWSIS